jgi:predicted nucleic acid-binding protein
MNNILIDSGFWYALYDKRDSYYDKAQEIFEYFSIGNVLIPYPSLYETINTRFVKNEIGLRDFKLLITGQNVLLLDDQEYKSEALELTFKSALDLKKPFSLVDIIIRLMLADEKLRINYLISFNPGDFIDICGKRSISLLSD